MAEEEPSKVDNNVEKFKKPLLVGKVGKLPKKHVNVSELKKPEEVTLVVPTLATSTNDESTDSTTESEKADHEPPKSIEDTESELSKIESIPTPKQNIQYTEPPWSGMPETDSNAYTLEILKEGKIIGTFNLMDKPYFVIGRLANCDMVMAHPTVSRYHAVLQFRKEFSEDEPKGFYLYDLSSVHGTFLNKRRLKPRTYVKLYVGHMFQLGCSTRKYILSGPNCDTEEESELTVTELKQKRQEEILKRKQDEEEAIRKAEEEREALAKKLQERGVDWGMGEDADEEEDLSENPYAQTNNEELYLDDPKKALRGFMEREGFDLEYECNEHGPGQFLCKVQLPLDDDRGRPIVAEVLHKGKKKEAVIQCALEACRILDRHGILRQATHESRKRKAKNWEENDFYDSDDDTFLDRTGTIEKKRENRMKQKLPQQAETYEGLVEKENRLQLEISSIEKHLSAATKSKKRENNSSQDEDSLESYMKQLSQTSTVDKEKISKMKSELQKLRQEHANVTKLIGIAKPTALPNLSTHKTDETIQKVDKKKLPMFGKRLKVKVNLPARPKPEEIKLDNDIEEEEMDVDTDQKKEENKEETEEEKMEEAGEEKMEECILRENIEDKVEVPKPVGDVIAEKLEKVKEAKKKSTDFIKDWNKMETSFNKIYPLMSHNHEHFVSSIWKSLKRLHPEYSMEKKQEVLQIFHDYTSDFESVIDSDKFLNDSDFVISGVKQAESGADISKIAEKILYLAKEITHMINEKERLEMPTQTCESDEENSDGETKNPGLKIKGKKKGPGKEKGPFREDYSMWVPPEGQSGDGRTSLNDKYGY